MTPDFEFLVSEFGRPLKAVALPGDVEAYYRGRLPDSLLDFWLEAGVGLMLRGKFQFCLPSDYAALCTAVLGNDAMFDANRTHIFGFTAFGELFMWHEEHRRLQVNLPYLIAAADYVDPSPLEGDRAIATCLFGLDRGAADMFDSDTAKPLFSAALGKLGELAPGECYGFVPALGLGGTAKLDRLRRMSAPEHLLILAGLGRPRLMSYTTGRQSFVRTIGT